MNPSYPISGQEAQEACDPAGAGTFASSSNAENRSPSPSDGAEYFAAVIGNSRYLKSAQSLLEELVDVVGGGCFDEKFAEKLSHGRRTGCRRRLSSELKAELLRNKCGHLLADSDKHEQLMKFAKLIALLEKVESRYEEYYHQMEEVVSSFEMIAGVGAAKCYTAMALVAMSRHLRMLRDAIVSQIHVEKRKLFQDLSKISRGLSQPSLFDRDTSRSRMSPQQLGAIQSERQVWRPSEDLTEDIVKCRVRSHMSSLVGSAKQIDPVFLLYSVGVVIIFLLLAQRVIAYCIAWSTE